MISYYAVLLVASHFLADFICQTDRMAIGKSKSFLILGEHVLAYTIALYFCIALFIPNITAIQFVVINAILHFITDAITSRITSYLWLKEKRHWFFVMIGFDQLIHYTCLFTTYNLLVAK